MTKPFVLIIILLVIPVFEDYRKATSIWKIILPALLLMLSVIFKPNFALAFIPALGIFILIKKRDRFKNYLLAFYLVLPSIIFLGYQFFSTYFFPDNKVGGTGDEIIFSLFGAWKVHSPCIPLSILRGVIFPVLILFFRRKEIKTNDYLIISWLIYLTALIEVSLLAEKESFYAFNFSNGYSFSLISLYTFSLIELFKWMKEIALPSNIFGLKYNRLSVEQKRAFVSAILMYWGVISGFIYLSRQLLGYGFS
jgi:hypothetical protein